MIKIIYLNLFSTDVTEKRWQVTVSILLIQSVNFSIQAGYQQLSNPF